MEFEKIVLMIVSTKNNDVSIGFMFNIDTLHSMKIYAKNIVLEF